MKLIYIIGLILAIVIIYYFVTGGWDVGENLQFTVVGFLLGIVASSIGSSLLKM